MSPMKLFGHQATEAGPAHPTLFHIVILEYLHTFSRKEEEKRIFFTTGRLKEERVPTQQAQ